VGAWDLERKGQKTSENHDRELKEFLHMCIGRAGQNIYIDQAQYLQAVLQ